MLRSVVIAAIIGVATSLSLVACRPRVQSLSLNPSEINLGQVGATLQIEAEPRDRLGARVGEAIVSYRSRDPEIASVSSTGLVTARGSGTTTIVVQVEGSEAMEFVHVEVRVPERLELRPTATTCYIGGLKRLEAQVLDHNGKVFSNVHFDWSSSDESLARSRCRRLRSRTTPGGYRAGAGRPVPESSDGVYQ